MPTQLLRFLELSSTLELSCYQALTLSIVYSIVFLHILSIPNLCISPFPILCLILCFPFMYTSHCYVFSCTLIFSDFWICSLIPYIRPSLMYVFDMFEYQL